MAYAVTFKITGRYKTEIDKQTDIPAILAAAESAFESADFGDAYDIEGTPVVIEDENGNRVYDQS